MYYEPIRMNLTIAQTIYIVYAIPATYNRKHVHFHTNNSLGRLCVYTYVRVCVTHMKTRIKCGNAQCARKLTGKRFYAPLVVSSLYRNHLTGAADAGAAFH